jgi:hypothetical protein
MYQVRGRWFAMVMVSRYFQLRKEGLVGQVEKMSHREVTCSVGRRNDAVESARKCLIPIASHSMDDFIDSYRGWPATTGRIRALDVIHNQHNVQVRCLGNLSVQDVSQSLPGS